MAINKYDDIIDLPHHQSAVRPHMSPDERAAQFSPYAALTGYDALVKETARLTDRRPELSDEELEELDRKLHIIQAAADAGQKPEASVSFFVPDEKKEGGSFRTITAKVKKIDFITKTLVFLADNEISPGEIIPIPDILDIGGRLVEQVDDWEA